MSVLHERDATFQIKCSFRVDETLLFEMGCQQRNRNKQKDVISRRRNACFFFIQFFLDGLTPELGRGSPDLSRPSFQNCLFRLSETPTFEKNTCFA